MGDKPNNPLALTALSVADVAKILASAYGRRITEDQVREAAQRGDLIRADGTINLVQYVAFLAKEVCSGGD
jgi:hypothetical protein